MTESELEESEIFSFLLIHLTTPFPYDSVCDNYIIGVGKRSGI